MRNLETHKVQGKNSMQFWTTIKNPLRVCLNFAVIYLCRFIPSLWLKNVLYRLIGMKVGKNVSVGLMVMFDIFFPELIEIGDNSIIGYNATILAHEYLIDEWRTGRVKIGKDVMIGANCMILAGITIGDRATVSACSLVNKDVKEGAVIGGVPGKELRRGEKS